MLKFEDCRHVAVNYVLRLCLKARFLSLIFILFSVELNPYAAHVYFNRANLYASLRKYKESEEDYTRGKNVGFSGEVLVRVCDPALETLILVQSALFFVLCSSRPKGLAKLGNIVMETLIPAMFPRVAKLGNIRFGSKICVCEAKMFLT